MNPLVEYLQKHHDPGGNAIQHVRVDDFIDKIDWTRRARRNNRGIIWAEACSLFG